MIKMNTSGLLVCLPQCRWAVTLCAHSELRLKGCHVLSMQNVQCGVLGAVAAGQGPPNQHVAKGTETVILSRTAKGDSIALRLSLR